MNNTPSPLMTVGNDLVISMDFTLTVDGEIFDQSEAGEPIQFLQGHGQVIPGLEQAIHGMAVGDSLEIDIEPDDGYGEEDQEAYAAIPREEFPAEIPLIVGVELQLRDQDGDVLEAYIDEVRDDVVMLNFNHRLAGKRLHFWVKIVDIREATPEEIEHGHAHVVDEDFTDEDEPE